MHFRDLKLQYLRLKSEMDEAIVDVMTSANFISGGQVSELEDRLAEYVGVKHCISCANGTDALTLALKVWNIGEGDAVFVPDFTFFSSGETIALEGATPVFVDVEEDTFNVSPKSLELAIQKVKEEEILNPRVIVAVDLFGLPANFPKIREIADKYNLYILEDGAQGFGGRIGDRVACSFGDIATTSFFPAKPLGCYGDGGAVFTNNDEWADLIRSLRIHGKGSNKYDNIRIGMNSRLDTIQAAVLLIKLNAFKEYELEDVNKVADVYTEKLRDVVKVPYVPKGYYSSWAQYSILLPSEAKRDELQTYLQGKEIPSMIYYMKPMSQQEAFASVDCRKVDLSTTADLCKRVLSLPMHPYLNLEEQMMIIEEIRNYLS